MMSKADSPAADIALVRELMQINDAFSKGTEMKPSTDFDAAVMARVPAWQALAREKTEAAKMPLTAFHKSPFPAWVGGLYTALFSGLVLVLVLVAVKSGAEGSGTETAGSSALQQYGAQWSDALIHLTLNTLEAMPLQWLLPLLPALLIFALLDRGLARWKRSF